MSEWPDVPGVLELPDGTWVRGASWRRRVALDPEPEFACLLLGRCPADVPWPHVWVRWPDFGVPVSTSEAVDALRVVRERAAGQRVAVLCGGGRRRTGTAMAALMVLGGSSAADSVQWVRAHCSRRAIETPWQRQWVIRLADGLAG